eukprot:s358_g4.t1
MGTEFVEMSIETHQAERNAMEAVETENRRVFSKAELYEQSFPWTIIAGQVYAIGPFIPQHPGGFLIRRAIGEDATELFLSHHCPTGPAVTTLES